MVSSEVFFLCLERSKTAMNNTTWDALDFEKTVRDFDFTRRAIRRMNSVVYSAEFEEMDSEAIFRYLFEEMELVSFKDFLKRYIYERAQITEPYHQITDDDYKEIIMSSFEENNAPHSFEPVSTKWNAIVKNWLTQDSVKRSVVFLLGFGLNMNAEDVSEFLTKVLKEEDIKVTDPEEVVYWYCCQNSLRYAKAKQLLEDYENLASTGEERTINFLENPSESSCDYLSENIRDEQDLKKYLARLKSSGVQEGRQTVAFSEFCALLLKAKEVAAKMYQKDEEEIKGNHIWTAGEITAGDLEKIISCGIPVNKSGNLQKMSASVLSKHFRQKRMSRQRIDKILSKEMPVDRFDLITLLFFICSQEQEMEEPEIRCRNYIDEINDILKRSGMMGLYPVNPYESFILMCLLSEEPLATYAEIWDLSYSTTA